MGQLGMFECMFTLILESPRGIAATLQVFNHRFFFGHVELIWPALSGDTDGRQLDKWMIGMSEWL